MGRKDSEMQVSGKDKKTEKQVIISKEDVDSEKAVHSASRKKAKKKKEKHAVFSKKHGKKDGGLEQTKDGRKSKKSKTVETIVVSEGEEQEKAASSSSKKLKKKKDKLVESALSAIPNTSLNGKRKAKRGKTKEDVNAAENGVMKEAHGKKMKRKRDKSAETALSTTPVSTNNGSGKSKRSTKKKQGNDVILVEDDLARSSSELKRKDGPVVAESLTAHNSLHSGSDKPSKSKKAPKRKLANVIENDEVKSEVQETSPKKQKKEEGNSSGTGTNHARDKGAKSKKKKKHKKQRKEKDAGCHSTSDVTGIKDLSKTKKKKQKEEDVEDLEITVRSDSSAKIDTKRHKKKKKKSTNSDSSDGRHVSSVEKNGAKSKKTKHDSQKKDSDLLTAAPESSRSKAKKIKSNGKTPSDKEDATISPEPSLKTDVKSEKKAWKRKHQGMEEIQGKEEKQSSLSEPKVKKEKVMDMDDTEGSVGPKQLFEVSSAAASKKKKVKSKDHDKSPSKRKRKSSESWDYSKYTSDKTKLSGSADYKSVGFNYDDTVTVVSVKEGNPDGLGEVEKERRRLLQEEVDTVTGKRGDVQKDGVDIAASATPIMQTGQWSTACLGSSDRQQKFFRLLGGMKSTSGNDNQSSSSKAKSRNSQSPLKFKKPTSESKFSFGSPHSKMAMDKSQESSVNKMLESQFETAMQRKITKGKVSGLGYSEAEDPKTKTFFIDKHASKSVKFED